MNYIFLIIIIFIIFILINFLINKDYIEKYNNFNNLSIETRIKYYMRDTYYKKIYISNKMYKDKNYINNNNYRIYKTNIN